MSAYVPPWALTPDELMAYAVPSPIGDSSRNPGSVDEMRQEGGALADYAGDERAMKAWLGAYLRKPRWSSVELIGPALRGEPLIIWRATRTEKEIWPGAYVTLARGYAADHRANALRGEGRLLRGKAFADELIAVNPQEFWYAPRSLRAWHAAQVKAALRRGDPVPMRVLEAVRSSATKVRGNPGRSPRPLWKMTRTEFEDVLDEVGEVRHADGVYRRLGPKTMPRGGDLPCVDFGERDHMDTGPVVSSDSVARDYLSPAQRRELPTRPNPRMNIEAGRTLYHGTLRRHERAIRAQGLLPGVGANTLHAYDDHELVPFVFAASTPEETRAAIITHIAADTGKPFSRVTRDDVAELGMVVEVPRVPFARCDVGESMCGLHPEHVEEDDWYARVPVRPTYYWTRAMMRDFADGRVVRRATVPKGRSRA